MTLDEINKTKEDATPKGQDSLRENESNSNQDTRHYTEEEYKKGVEDAIAQYGDRIKRERIDPIVKERDSLKSQITTVSSEQEDNKADIEKLMAKLDDLASEDPNRFNVVKELKEARALKADWQAKRRELDTELAKIADDKKEIAIDKRDKLIYSVADEFVTSGGEEVDMDAFMEKALKFNLTEKEGLVLLAETMGLKSKTPETPKPPPVKPYSGMTEGGSDTFTREQIKVMSTEEYMKLKPRIEAAQKAGKIK